MNHDPCENDMFTDSSTSFITFFKMKGFWALHLSIAYRPEIESEQIMNLFLQEATNFKARSIALVSALTIELADGNGREYICCRKTAAECYHITTIRTISIKCRVFWCYWYNLVKMLMNHQKSLIHIFFSLSSKFKVGFGFNHGEFSGIAIGTMSSKLISECSKLDFIRKIELYHKYCHIKDEKHSL